MTRKVYKSAMGKTVDMGALMLQNEQIRAVGNMNVNARGDLLDSQNQVVEPRNRTAQRQYRRQSASSAPIATTKNVRNKTTEIEQDTFEDMPEDDFDLDPTPQVTAQPEVSGETPRGGLAAAIARSREVKQELDKTRRQQQQSQGIKKI